MDEGTDVGGLNLIVYGWMGINLGVDYGDGNLRKD